MVDRRISKNRADILSGWKEIANYLGKGVRTVQRYEHHLGLPVRRTTGSDRAPVLATTSELDAWVSARPIAETFHLTRPPVIITSSVRESAAEMHRLRDQMQELRAELKVSLGQLNHTIDSLQRKMGHLNGMNQGTRLPIPKSRSRSATPINLLSIDGSARKAS